MGSIITTSNLFLDHWKKPLPELTIDLEKAFKISIEYGDNEYASYAAHNIVYQFIHFRIYLSIYLAKKLQYLICR